MTAIENGTNRTGEMLARKHRWQTIRRKQMQPGAWIKFEIRNERVVVLQSQSSVFVSNFSERWPVVDCESAQYLLAIWFRENGFATTKARKSWWRRLFGR